jgi:hypothetical protein
MVQFAKEEINDLRLWKHLLSTKASLGMSMNLIIARSPSLVCLSVACPFGIGGYSLSGRTWQIQIPQSSPLLATPKSTTSWSFWEWQSTCGWSVRMHQTIMSASLLHWLAIRLLKVPLLIGCPQSTPDGSMEARYRGPAT